MKKKTAMKIKFKSNLAVIGVNLDPKAFQWSDTSKNRLSIYLQFFACFEGVDHEELKNYEAIIINQD
jgi:hypothetical protein